MERDIEDMFVSEWDDDEALGEKPEERIHNPPELVPVRSLKCMNPSIVYETETWATILGEKPEQGSNVPRSLDGLLPPVQISQDTLDHYVTDSMEAQKYLLELKQQLADTPPTRPVRVAAIQWRLNVLLAWALLAGIQLTSAAELSPPEQYANAFSTIVWSMGVFLVLYTASKVLWLLGTSLSQVMLTLCAAMVASINAFTALLNTFCGIIPGIAKDVSSYMRWMKITTMVSAGAQALNAVMPILKAPFGILGFFLGHKPTEVYSMRSEGAQKFNKYGVLTSAVFACLMFILVPVLGFAKSYKMWEPMRRMCEHLPYVTWFIDWLTALAEGKATVNDIPNSINAFRDGEEIPVSKPTGSGVCPVCQCYLCRCPDDGTSPVPIEVKTSRKGKEKVHGHQRSASADDALLDEVYDLVNEGNEDEASSVDSLSDDVQRMRIAGWPENGLTPRDLHALTTEQQQENLQRNKEILRRSRQWKADQLLRPVEGYESAGMLEQSNRPTGVSYPMRTEGKAGEQETEEDDVERYVREEEEAQALLPAPLADGEPTWWELICEASSDLAWLAKSHYDEKVAPYVTVKSVLAVAAVVTTIGVALAAALASGKSDVIMPEGHGRKPMIRYHVPIRTRRPLKKRLEHLESEEDIDAHLNGERQEHRNVEMDRWDALKEEEDEYYAKRHLVGGPSEIYRGEGAKVNQKAQELGMKWFPRQIDPATVAKRRRAIRRAQTTPKSHTLGEKVRLEEARKDFPLYEEALLGKQRFVYNELASTCVKIAYDAEETSSGTLIPGATLVPLHSLVEGKEVSVHNAALSAKLRGEVIPLHNDAGEDLDLGLYHSYGAFACKSVKMRAPKNERVIQIGFTPKDEVEPSFGVGFCSAEGMYDAPTDFKVCGGGVYAVEDGALVGIHIGGGQHCNRFIPFTERLIEQIRSHLKVVPRLHSTLFH